jgi:hypothetical protein
LFKWLFIALGWGVFSVPYPLFTYSSWPLSPTLYFSSVFSVFHCVLSLHKYDVIIPSLSLFSSFPHSTF